MALNDYSSFFDGPVFRRLTIVVSSVAAMFVLGSLPLSGFANAQRNTCGDAVYQLQSYVMQVNQVANWEYHQGIPMRCGYNQWCAQQMLHQLNIWYSQQSALVNNWYSRISLNCSSQAPGRDLRGSDIGDLDPDEIEDLEVDDEDRTVRIRIPNNPRGFEPR